MKKVDFLIVGQGLAGTMLAFELLKTGSTFKIVGSPQKSKASLVAAGMVNPLVFKRLTKSWMVDELLPQMKSTYREIEALLNDRFYFEMEILKPLSEQEKELWIERKKNPEFSDYMGRIFDEAPVDNVLPSAGYGMVTNAGYLQLSKFLNAAELFFRRKDLLIEQDFNLSDKNNDGGFNLNDISAHRIVFCEGYHLSRNSIFDMVKLNPVKGEVLQIYAPQLTEDYILNKKVFVLPIGSQRFKVGSTYEWKDLSEQTTETGKNSIEERLSKLISTEYTIEHHWAGVRPTVIDRRPVMGRHPEYKNVYVFNGLGTKGVMIAPYFAREMTNYLHQNNYPLNTEVEVQRFFK